MPPCVFSVAVAFISFVINLSKLQWELKEQVQCLRGVLHTLRTLQMQPRVASLSLLTRTGSTKISSKPITRNISFIIKKKYKILSSYVIWQFIFLGFIALNVGSSNPFSFSRLKKNHQKRFWDHSHSCEAQALNTRLRLMLCLNGFDGDWGSFIMLSFIHSLGHSFICSFIQCIPPFRVHPFTAQCGLLWDRRCGERMRSLCLPRDLT